MNLPIDLDQKLARSEDMLAGDIENETVLMSIETGTYYTLNTTAASIWYHLDQPKSVEDLSSLLAQEYDKSAEDCQAAIITFAQRMLEKDMIRVL